MRGMPFSLQGKGVVQLVAEDLASGLWGSGGKKEASEPRSVLDHRRSRSPPTSTSTLSSSLGGGGGSSDTAGVAAVSDNPPHKWPASSQDVSSSAGEAEEGGRRDEWASELQPIPQEIGFTGADKCGLAVEDWENMLSDNTDVTGSPGRDRSSFLKWITGDVEDPSTIVPKQQLPQHQQLMFPQGPFPMLGDFDSSGVSVGGGLAGFGFLDSIFGCDPIGGVGGVTSADAASLGSSGSVASCGGFPFPSGNNNSNSAGSDTRALQIPPGLSSLRNTNFASSCGGNPSPNFPLVPPAMTNLTLPLTLPPAMLFQDSVEEKPQLFSPSFSLNPHQSQRPHNPTLFQPLPPSEHQQHNILLPPAKRHYSMTDSCPQIGPGHPFTDGGGGGQDLFLRRHQPQLQQHGFGGSPVNPFQNLQQKYAKPKISAGEVTAAAAAHHQEHQALIDQLTKAAELLEAGNSSNARGILARLNHQLSSPVGKPLIRSAFYFKEVLEAIVSNNLTASPSAPPTLPWKPPATALDVVMKLSAYKAFSDISPVVQFTNFTCIQVLLEELKGYDHIHIVDFDIGVGSQWSSFMQEIAQRRCSSVSAALLSLKITAFVSASSHHQMELYLIRENLSQFAGELNIQLELNILTIDSFDPSALTMGGDAIAVNIPVGASYTLTPMLLRLVKQLSPRIVVSVDHGCDRSDLTFSKHFINSLHSVSVLLDSIDAAGTSLEVVGKIERFLLQPRIESSVLRRYHMADKILPWRTLFASSGFLPVPFSNFTETQAECLLKRIQVRGFQVEKLQSSLLLYWPPGELVSVSAWRC